MRTPGAAAADQALLRALNVKTTLQALRRADAAPTLSQLAAAARLSRPTVESALAELLAKGWAAELPPTEAAMGRPARRYRFQAEAGHVAGLDIGMRKALAVVADLGGNVVGSLRCDLGDALPGPARLARAEALVDQCLAAAAVPSATLWAVTAGMPGLIDRSGRMTRSTVLPGLTGVDIAGRLAKRFGCRVNAENDANLATVAEHWLGCAQYVDDVAYILAGRRTGVGMIIGGAVHRGTHGAAGETGNLRMLGWYDAPGHLADPTGDAAATFAAAAGDPHARRAVNEYIKALSQGIAAIVLTVDPELVVLGGGLSRASDLILDPLREHLAGLCLTAPRVEASTLGDESVALGGVRVALDRVQSDVFDAALAG
jgi:predicted NBD/HSP70 family sugar kinase